MAGHPLLTPRDSRPNVGEQQRVYQWRRDQCILAGATYELACRIGADTTIDLHMACNVFEGAPPVMWEKVLFGEPLKALNP